MKKITSFMLMLLCAITAWAQSSLYVSETLPGTLENGQYSWTSGKIEKPDGHNTLRVTFLENTNKAWNAGFPMVCIAEFYLYDKNGNQVELTADKFSSNATQSDEGNMAAICNGHTTQQEGEGQYQWYWHSQWSGTPSPYGYHYLEVDLAGIENLDEYSIGWVTRQQNASPTKIVISTGTATESAELNANSQLLPKVSTDIVHLYAIKSVRSKKFLKYSEENAKPVQSDTKTNESYWYFTHGTDGKVVMHNLASDKVLGTNFEMSTEGEWYISPAKYRSGIVFCKTTDISSNNCIDDQSGSIGGWSHTAGDNEGTSWLVEEVTGVDVPMLSLKSKKISSIGSPVTEVTDGWYILNNVGRGNYVSQEGDNWKMRATSDVDAGNFAKDKAGYLFKITKNGEYYNIVSGNGRYFNLGYNTASTSENPVKFNITLIGGTSFCLFDTENGYAADGQATGNNFVGWSTSASTNPNGNDAYRLLPVALVDVAEIEILRTTLTEAINAAQDKYNSMKDYIGEGVGKYTAPANYETQFAAIVSYRDAIGETTTSADVDAKIAELEALIASFQINQPEAGKYYTFRNGENYITSNVAANDKIACGAKDASAIYYFDGEHLLSYTTGLYFGLNANDWTFEAIGSNDISKIQLVAAANGAAGLYNISSAGRWLHLSTDNGNYINRCQNNTCGNAHNWAIEEVTTLPVTISAAKYATFYAPVAVKVADDVKAYAVTVASNGEWATLTAIEGGVIPANTGVVLQGEVNTYNFAVTNTTATVDSDLTGTVAATYITEDAYVLSNGANGIGLYGAIMNQLENTAWKNNSHKAYLPMVSGAAMSTSLRFEFGGTTGIEEVEIRNEKEEIYDLTGRRVNEITKAGVYIVNGKKILVK